MTFLSPWFFLLFLLLPVIFFWSRRGQMLGLFPHTGMIERNASNVVALLPALLRTGALLMLVFALARPQDGQEPARKKTEALDIILVVDTSGSMEARDFVVGTSRPTRLEVVKDVMQTFIEDRVDDRIGLVVFGTEAFTQAPLTLDKGALSQFIEAIDIGMAGESTAIGDGLATSVARFKDIDAKSKVVVLLTDGSNQAGRVEPKAAAKAAKAFGVKVYTVGVGSDDKVPIMRGGRVQMHKFELDEELLAHIAKTTGGAYFRANDVETLKKVYETIDVLEKTEVEIETFDERDENYRPFAWAALGLLALELLFGVTKYRRIP